MIEDQTPVDGANTAEPTTPPVKPNGHDVAAESYKAPNIVDICNGCGEEKKLCFIDDKLCHSCALAEHMSKSKNTWDIIATVLDEIRKGTEQIPETDKKGNTTTKTHRLPPHIVEENVYQFALKVLKKRAKFFVDAYPYVFLPEDGQIFKLHNDFDAAQLLAKMRLRIKQPHYLLVLENLSIHIQGQGTEGRVEKLGTCRGDAVYINNGRGGMFRIQGSKISVEPNGTDDVLMLYPDLLPWPQMDEENLEKMKAISQRLGRIGAKWGHRIRTGNHTHRASGNHSTGSGLDNGLWVGLFRHGCWKCSGSKWECSPYQFGDICPR